MTMIRITVAIGGIDHGHTSSVKETEEDAIR